MKTPEGLAANRGEPKSGESPDFSLGKQSLPRFATEGESK
jgi:hypothetical protein